MPELILASTSRYRRELLSRLGLEFRAVAPPIDERQLERPEWSPQEVAEQLAAAKARSLAEQEPRAAIIGSDQVCVAHERVLHKPETAAVAVEQLLELAGREHQLITAVAIWHAGQLQMHTDITRLWMRPLSQAEAERYVAADAPLDCAGSYRLESRGIALFERIHSDDHTAIVGLPLLAVSRMLRGCGFELP